jgi:transcriptional regulator with XRE-family HTH domain
MNARTPTSLHAVPDLNERPADRKGDAACVRFGKLITAGRTAARLTQGELAAILKVSRTHLNAIERGRANLDLVLAVRLAQRLELFVTLADLGDRRGAHSVRLEKSTATGGR